MRRRGGRRAHSARARRFRQPRPRLGLVLERDDRDDGAEDLPTDDLVGLGGAGDDRGLVEEAAARAGLAAGDDLDVFCRRRPLDEAGLDKQEIRELSRRAGLPTWNEPASACLSSRIPYHAEVTAPKLRMIERGEEALRALGFRVCRVRHHDELARIEIGRGELARALEPEVSAAIVRDLKAAGYRYVTIDLQGYRMGSLNEGLPLLPA